MKHESRAPLIVALVLLILPVIYVGSYLALVVPHGRWAYDGLILNSGRVTHYRNLRNVSRHRRKELTEILFWPLEQIDRRVRPEAWESFWLRQPKPIP